MDIYNLLQQHTIDIYQLREKNYQIETVPARSLLHISRFDLYAKLFYIRNRNNKATLAEKVYIEHIKAFNPDGKEPGREDKNGYASFLTTFNHLIDYFEKNDFDPTISVIPVSENGIILDGSHRIATLAFYNKEVQIARFNNVYPKCMFNADYFINRGLSWNIADTIASEILNWNNDILVACLWPKIGNKEEREEVNRMIDSHFSICYKKALHVSFNSFVKLISKVYKDQAWVGSKDNNFLGATDKARNCYAKNGNVSFIFFQSSNLSKVLTMKEEIREMFPYEKHSIHITDNINETKDIASYILDKENLNKWLYEIKGGYIAHLKDRIHEQIFYFKKVQWLNIKVFIYSLITLRFLRKQQ